VLKVDKLDRKILFELDKDARQPFSQVAKKVRASKQVVAYRIDRLVKNGAISGFFTAIDHSKLGFFSFRVYIKLRNISPEKQKKMVDYINKNDDIWWFVTVDGYWDIDFVILVKDVFDYYSIWEKFIGSYKQYIYKYETVVYSHIHGFPKSYLIDKKNEDRGFIISSKRELLQPDDLDLKILRILSKNARIETTEIAKQTSTTVKTIVQRIKSLEERKIIVGYRAGIDLKTIGYRYYKIIFYLLDTRKINAMKSWALNHPNVPFINKTIGGGDFELEIHSKNHEEFHAILNEFKALFHDSIDHYYYFWVIEEYKMIYYPT